MKRNHLKIFCSLFFLVSSFFVLKAYGDELSKAVRAGDRPKVQKILQDGYIKGSFGFKTKIDLTKPYRRKDFFSYDYRWTNLLGLAIISKNVMIMSDILAYMKKNKIPFWVPTKFNSNIDHPFILAMKNFPKDIDQSFGTELLTEIYLDSETESLFEGRLSFLTKENMEALIAGDFPDEMKKRLLHFFILKRSFYSFESEFIIKKVIELGNKELIEYVRDLLTSSTRHFPLLKILPPQTPEDKHEEPKIVVGTENTPPQPVPQQDLNAVVVPNICDKPSEAERMAEETVGHILSLVYKKIEEREERESEDGNDDAASDRQDHVQDDKPLQEKEHCVASTLSITPSQRDLACPNCNHSGISSCHIPAFGALKRITSPQFTLRGVSYYFDPGSDLDQLCQFYGYKKAIAEHVLPPRYSVSEILSGGDRSVDLYMVQMMADGSIKKILSPDRAMIKNLYCE
jgi:hypothetical protein